MLDIINVYNPKRIFLGFHPPELPNSGDLAKSHDSQERRTLQIPSLWPCSTLKTWLTKFLLEEEGGQGQKKETGSQGFTCGLSVCWSLFLLLKRIHAFLLHSDTFQTTSRGAESPLSLSSSSALCPPSSPSLQFKLKHGLLWEAFSNALPIPTAGCMPWQGMSPAFCNCSPNCLSCWLK